MRIPQNVPDLTGCSDVPSPSQAFSFPGLLRHVCLFSVVLSLAIGALGQQQGGYSDPTQSTGSMDCTDPALANSSQCSGQGSQGMTSPMTPQAPPSVPNTFGNQQQNQNSNYTDVETLARQANGGTFGRQMPAPPEPLTEFQKFVASTTAQVLPIYGASLFRNVPSTFSPLDLSPVPSNFVLGPGDELRIRIWGQVNFQANLRIDRSGDIYLPQVGPVHVAGIPYSALDGHLRSAVGRVYRNFDLTADVGQTRAIQVYLSGEARRPGVYTVSGLSTLVDALFASGGPSSDGSLRHIELRRDGSVVTDFDLYGLLVHGDKSKDVPLQAGDVIFIPPVGPEVAVTGSVRNPAIYEMRSNETAADMIADASGPSTVAAESRISIERIEDHQARVAMEVAYDAKGLATPVHGGDLIRVFPIVPMYKKTVILRGNLANPGRFEWHPGMHLSDLIPDKDSLVTRDYWWKRAQLGLPSPEFIPSQGISNMHQPVGNSPITLQHLSTDDQEMNGAPPYGQQNLYNGSRQPGQYPAQQGPYGSQQQQQNGATQDQYASQQGQNAPPNAQYGPPGGQYGTPYGQNGQQQNGGWNQEPTSEGRIGSSSLASQQSQLSRRSFPFAQRTEVKQLAPEIDWNYAVIERLNTTTLKTTLIPFDLGKLVLDHDASQDLALEAGDVVSIFSDADIHVPIAQQTKFVTLGGEFIHSGVYTVMPGETLRHLVERAGGLSPDAYLYGSEYTRESTRISQQARIDEYVQSISLGIQRSTLAIAASPVSSAQDLASGAASQTGAEQLLASLRKIRATGRIVLTFTPDSKGLNALPDITMEDGDHFFVPSVPATVNVVGSVYNQNSFLYKRQQRAGNYLQLAGGPNKAADWKQEFIIRADGEVVSHDVGGGLWSNSFNNVRMYPGDTIVVPEKTFKPSGLRGLIEWSQLVSNFALGAAALTIL